MMEDIERGIEMLAAEQLGRAKADPLPEDRAHKLHVLHNYMKNTPDCAGARLLRECVLGFIRANGGSTNAAIARELSLVSADRMGKYPNWFVWIITRKLAEDRAIIHGRDCSPIRRPLKGWWAV